MILFNIKTCLAFLFRSRFLQILLSYKIIIVFMYIIFQIVVESESEILSCITESETGSD